MTITIGREAPAFALFNGDKQKVQLEDFRGKNVLLLFFPLAFSSVCTKELCSIRDNISGYNEVNAQVLGISVDSLYVLNKFRQEQNINFPLLSDFNKDVSRAYEVLYDIFPPFGMKGVSKRAAVVVDKAGIIQYVEVCSSPAELPKFGLIQEVLQKIA